MLKGKWDFLKGKRDFGTSAVAIAARGKRSRVIERGRQHCN
jgi:hypothetical protein